MTASVTQRICTQERPGRSDREEEGAQRRPGELIRDQVPGLQPGVADAEVGRTHEHRQQRAAGGVGEDLGGAVEERGGQDDPDGGGAGDQEHARAPAR